MRTVLKTWRDHTLYIKFPKCDFYMEVNLLSHVFLGAWIVFYSIEIKIFVRGGHQKQRLGLSWFQSKVIKCFSSITTLYHIEQKGRKLIELMNANKVSTPCIDSDASVVNVSWVWIPCWIYWYYWRWDGMLPTWGYFIWCYVVRRYFRLGCTTIGGCTLEFSYVLHWRIGLTSVVYA